MKNFSSIRKADILTKMFPYTFNLIKTTEAISNDAGDIISEGGDTTIVTNYPCSLQYKSTEYQALINKQMVLLCPYLDLPNGSGTYKIIAHVNGKEFIASSSEILNIENQNIYEINGIKIGCRIDLSTSAYWIL